jgi:hypothetical protein
LPVAEMVSWPARTRCSVARIASTGARIRISSPLVSWSFKYVRVFSITWRSYARLSSNQKMAAWLVARARFTASLTQSWIGRSFVRHMRQMSPASTACWVRARPPSSSTRTVPGAWISNVLSCEPYSSALCAIRPTFDTVPMVRTSNAPCALQSSIVAW